MEKRFSFQRIKFLFSQYFIENWRKDVLMFAIMSALALVFTFLKFQGGGFICFIFLIIYAARIFGLLGRPASAMHYLLIPASSAEKVTVNLLLVNGYYLISMLLCGTLGEALGSTFRSLRHGHGLADFSCGVFVKSFIPHGAVLLLLLCFLSALVFASVYFRKKALIKFFLTIFVLSVIFFIVDVILLTIFTKNGHITGNGFDDFPQLSTTMQNVIVYTIFGGILLFFNLLTYFRLRETEC